MKLLPYDDLRSRGIPYSKVQIWRLEKRGDFPRRVPLGPGRHAWAEDEVDSWIRSRIAARDAAPAGGKDA
jgi:prophage regulatory protein